MLELAEALQQARFRRRELEEAVTQDSSGAFHRLFMAFSWPF